MGGRQKVEWGGGGVLLLWDGYEEEGGGRGSLEYIGLWLSIMMVGLLKEGRERWRRGEREGEDGRK